MVFLHRERRIPWTNVKSFNSDNCPTMKGQKSGLVAKTRQVAPDAVHVRCICHLANPAGGAALKVYPVNLNDLLCDMSTHVDMR